MRRAVIFCCVMLISAADAHAQAVQLPTFRFFSVQTTVSVPDRGGAYLGGGAAARTGSSRRTLPLWGRRAGLGPIAGGRAFGAERRAGVSATIIDHAEHDAAVRSQAVGGNLIEKPVAPPLSADVMQQHKSAAGGVAGARREAARQQAEQDADELAEAKRLYYKGRESEEDGDLGQAKIYYRMSARRVEGEPRRRILAHLQRLEAASRFASHSE